MRIVSINIGMPREIRDGDETVLSGIYKESVVGPVQIDQSGLAGDGQADPDHHGGQYKAVYAYPAEHYALWQQELGRELAWGVFGENLTVEGLDETTVFCGDELSLGSTRLRATQPRKPCRKLGLRMGDLSMVKRFWQAGRTGIYFEVLQPGTVRLGDSLEVLSRAPQAPTVHQIWALAARVAPGADPARINEALALPYLADEWRRPLQVALER